MAYIMVAGRAVRCLFVDPLGRGAEVKTTEPYILWCGIFALVDLYMAIYVNMETIPKRGEGVLCSTGRGGKA